MRWKPKPKPIPVEAMPGYDDFELEQADYGD